MIPKRFDVADSSHLIVWATSPVNWADSQIEKVELYNKL